MIPEFNVVLLVVTGSFILYLAVLSILALLKRQKPLDESSSKRRFSILIPAYNEAGTITPTIKSMHAIDYPDELYDITVIADNCTDNTAAVADKEGATVWERDNAGQRGKGHALRWAINRILTEKPDLDAVVVVDADSIVSANLLKVMNLYMDKGARVIQGYLSVQPQPGVWSSEIIRMGFTLYNYVRPLGEKVLGLPTGLRGNGMCFSMEVLRKIPWKAYSQTEDLEYGMILLLNGVDVVFAPEAIGYGIMPGNARAAESQRERWEMGRYPLIRKYAARLFSKAVISHSWKIMDALVNLIMPPLVNLMSFIVMMAGINFILWQIRVVTNANYLIWWILLAGIGIVHLVTGLLAAKADRSLYKALFYIPRYALWKLKLYLKVLLLQGRTSEWVRTSRE